MYHTLYKTISNNIFQMKGIKLIVPVIVLIIVLGSGTALGDGTSNEESSHYFDVGSFCQYGSDGIAGKYALSGLEGCMISVYSAEGSHLLDIIYKSDHMEIYFQILDDAVLKKLLSKEEWLKDYINDLSYKKMAFERSEISFTYGNCSIEMHDTSINFLKIHTTGDIIFSNLSKYNLTWEGNIVEISKNNFSGTIISNDMLEEKDGKIVAKKNVMFRGTDLGPIADKTPEIYNAEEAVSRAIKARTLGGEITIVRKNNSYKVDSVSYYGNVSIKNVTINGEKAEFFVSGDDHTAGKTIKVNIGGAMSPKDLKVMFDGKEIPMADNLTDVLNPDNDGLQPEYSIVNVKSKCGDEFFLLISIPHFSEHKIVIESLVKNPIFMGMAAVSAMLVVVAAAWAMFRKDKSIL